MIVCRKDRSFEMANDRRWKKNQKKKAKVETEAKDKKAAH
jgi:hypothetical protein